MCVAFGLMRRTDCFRLPDERGGMVLSSVLGYRCSRRMARHGLVFLLGVGLAAGLIGLPTTASEASFSELVESADAAFRERFIEGRMKEAIAFYELIPGLDPLAVQSQAFVLNRLSQLCYELTTFSEGNTPQDREHLQKGKGYGLRSLRLVSDFAEWETEDFKKALSYVLDPAALLWTANNWGALFGYDPLQGMLGVNRVRTMYEHSLAIEESYWGASAHNALGALLIVVPEILGGDIEQGRKHLERAVTLNPDYLENRVVYAQYWGFTYDFLGNVNGIRDRELIERELNLVLEAPIGDWPFWNREAKKEVQILLAQLRELSP